MSDEKMPRWLEWAREIQGLCQTGLAFAGSDYETQRYTRLNEIAAEMIAREVLEESGFVVKPRKVVAVFDANRGGRPLELYHAYKIIFLCDITGGEARASDETMDVGFFSFEDLPPLSLQRTNEKHLAEVRAHLDDESRPAAFD